MEDKKVPVAYLSYDGLTDPLGQSQIIPYLIPMSDEGYRFTIFSFEKPSAFKELSLKIGNQLDKHRINWYPLRYTKWPPILSTIWDVWKLWRQFLKVNNTERFRIVHCRSYVTSIIGLRVQKNFGIRFIFDMRGFWADERVEGGLWNMRNPAYTTVYKYFKKKEKAFLTRADLVISLTENAKNEILSWGLKTAPIIVIPTCVDVTFFNPKEILASDQERLRTQLKIQPGDFVLLYLGSWGTWYLTNEMLSFFNELKKVIKNAKFLILSKDPVDLNKFSKKQDVIVAFSPRDQVPLHISIASAGVFFIKTSFSKKSSSATKFGELMAMGIPVVTNTGWGDVESLRSSEKIYLVDLNVSENKFNEAINFLINKAGNGSDKDLARLTDLSIASAIVKLRTAYAF